MSQLGRNSAAALKEGMQDFMVKTKALRELMEAAKVVPTAPGDDAATQAHLTRRPLAERALKDATRIWCGPGRMLVLSIHRNILKLGRNIR